MRYFYSLVLITVMLLVPSVSNSIEAGHCVLDKIYQTYPSLKPENNIEATNILDQLTVQFSSSMPLMKLKSLEIRKAAGQGTVIVPVVFHVMRAFPVGDEDITFAQMEEALVQVNEDFSLQNARRTGNIYTDFLGIEANIGIRFELAQRDPEGYPTNGVTHTTSIFTNNGGQIELKETIQWPRDRYLNIWVVSSSDGSSGSAFAFLPASVVNRPIFDGIVTSHWAVGRTGTALNSHLGNLTHEIGHWANLNHIWGSESIGLAANCNTDDAVIDTPNTVGNQDNNLCGSLVQSCGSPDNVSNFMDYACEVMYTNDQQSRMLAALSSSISGRNNTWTPENQIAAGIIESPVYALFRADKAWVAPGGQVTYTDESEQTLGGAITQWQWSFPGGTPDSFSGQLPPVVTYSSLGTFQVSLTVTNDLGSNIRVREQQIDVNDNVIMNKTGIETVNIDNGWFYDSGFTDNYSIDEDGILTILPEAIGKVIEVDFFKYNMEPQEANGSCLWDFMEVFDGTSISAPLIGKYCGKFPQPTIRATNADGALTFHFTSDDNTFINGWKAKLTAVDPGAVDDTIVMGTTNSTALCGVKFYDSGKNLPYNNDENVTITLNPQVINDLISVNFTSFEMEGDACQWDYMEIFDGPSISAPQIGAKYCGNTLPGNFTANNPDGALTFRFISDDNATLAGWEADVICGSNDIIYINGFE